MRIFSFLILQMSLEKVIPGTEEPGWLQSMGLQESDMT